MESELQKIEYTVPAEQAGLRLDSILRRQLCISGSEMKRLKRNGGIFLNDINVHVDVLVNTGDRVCVKLEQDGNVSETVVPVRGPLAILYEDEHLMVVDKPPFVPVHTTGGHMNDSLANFVAYYYQHNGKPMRFRAVHRLDRNTSGIVLIAKSAYVTNLLREQRERGEMQRMYIAVAHGNMPEEGEIEAPILRPLAATIRREVRPDGDYAFTRYRKADGNETFSLLQVFPKTGRTHQIRVHMQYIGHPLVSDFLYGEETPQLIRRHALHCARLSFTHPVTGEKLCIKAPLPEDMRTLCRLVGLNTQKI